MLSFVIVAALIIGVALVVSRLRSQAPGQNTDDTWSDPTSPAFFSSDTDTSTSHSGGWGDIHGGGGSWDSDSSGGDSSGGDASSGSDD